MATPKNDEERPSLAARFLLGLVAGYSVAVDFSAAPVSALLLGVVAADDHKKGRATGTLLAAGAGLLLGILPAAVYNTVAFGSPLRTGYSFHINFPETRSLLTMYSGSFAAGLFGLLFHFRAGLLLYSPILLLGMLTAWSFAQKLGARRAAVTVLPWVGMLLLTAKHATWHGGGAHDARYLMLVMPLFCLPVGAAYARATTPGALHLFTALFLLSALVQFIKHTAGWVRNPLPYLTDFLCTMKFDVEGVHYFDGAAVLRLLDWLYPHPLAAAAILAGGLLLATQLYARKPAA